MPNHPKLAKAKFLALTLALSAASCTQASEPASYPDPKEDLKAADGVTSATLIVAGGCFWCTEAVFDRVPGVKGVESGYAGGTEETADYQTVSSGTTTHAESIKITYDPTQVSFGKLLKVFFLAAHDPTQVDRQGPDSGKQYRSVIFYENDEQKRVAEAYIKQLDEAKVYEAPIATKLEKLSKFFPAEGYHQKYAKNHPTSGYIEQQLPPKYKKLEKVLASDAEKKDGEKNVEKKE